MTYLICIGGTQHGTIASIDDELDPNVPVVFAVRDNSRPDQTSGELLQSAKEIYRRVKIGFGSEDDVEYLMLSTMSPQEALQRMLADVVALANIASEDLR